MRCFKCVFFYRNVCRDIAMKPTHKNIDQIQASKMKNLVILKITDFYVRRVRIQRGPCPRHS